MLDHLIRERLFPKILCIEFDYAARGKKRRAAVARLVAAVPRGVLPGVSHRDWNVTLVHTAARRSKRRDLLYGAAWVVGILPPLGNHRPAAG